MSANDFLSELEKIAHFSADVISPDDVAAEPMVPDTAPHVDPKTVEETQTLNAEVPHNVAAIDQQPALSPEDLHTLESTLAQAKQEYEAATQHLASLEEEWKEFEKTAEEIKELLPSMGALARLIHYSTDLSVPEGKQKLASERLIIALRDEEGFAEMIEKTAGELFVDEENVNQLLSHEGMEYVVEHLASFAESDELEKVAFDINGIANSVRRGLGEYVNATRNFWKLDNEISAAKQAVDEARKVLVQKSEAINAASKVENPVIPQQMMNEFKGAKDSLSHAEDTLDTKQGQKSKGRLVWGTGAAGLAGGAFMGGKAIANARKPKEGQVELSEKIANVTIIPDEHDYVKGGNSKMTVVRDYLKIAGAAGLLSIANNENYDMELRKEATEQFNTIARMNRADMEANFEKMATAIYSEPELHEIVVGKHNEELFDKIAYFIELEGLGADELEKVAGADSVAAKGVAGALTDAKSNIEEKLKSDKEHTETVKNGELGSLKADEMRGYNVINNPGAYKVEKTAATKAMLEEAELRKEAAYRVFVEADTFIKNNL